MNTFGRPQRFLSEEELTGAVAWGYSPLECNLYY